MIIKTFMEATMIAVFINIIAYLIAKITYYVYEFYTGERKWTIENSHKD